MSYEILYGQGALDQLLALNLPEITDCVEDAMSRLADDPFQHSRRGRKVFPLADGSVFRPQEFNFHCDRAPGQRVHCRVHFHFEQTERELHVISFTVKPYFVL